jgi:hypothetical protein
MQNNKREFNSQEKTQQQLSYLENITVSCVIFGFQEGVLKVLLSKYNFQEKWNLPSTFVLKDEDVDQAAKRLLGKSIDLNHAYQKQFYLFGDYNNKYDEERTDFLSYFRQESINNQWYEKRTVTIGYYVLVRSDKILEQENESIEKLDWVDVDHIPLLYGDHNAIIEKAIVSMRFHIGYIPLGFYLLPEKFTINELKEVYEKIIRHELDSRNFRRKLFSVNLIVKLDEKRKNGPHKAPHLYCFDKEKYTHMLESGLPFMFWNIK